MQVTTTTMKNCCKDSSVKYSFRWSDRKREIKEGERTRTTREKSLGYENKKNTRKKIITM